MIKCCFNCKYFRFGDLELWQFRDNCKKQNLPIYDPRSELNCLYYKCGLMNRLFPWKPAKQLPVSGGCIPPKRIIESD